MIKSYENTIDLNKEKIKLQTDILDELNNKIDENEKLIEKKKTFSDVRDSGIR